MIEQVKVKLQWLKAYAEANPLDWDFLVAQTPVGEQYFIDISPVTHLCYTIEETTRNVDGELVPAGLARHMSLAYRGYTEVNWEEESPYFSFFMIELGFVRDKKITSWQHMSKTMSNTLLLHFMQHMD